jgi:DNA repair exonuclease SbcCD ATPase subunit
MPSKIIRLAVQNLLRIEAAEVKPEGDSLVIVAGRNDQGKSSLLNCIQIALSGKNLPAEPIRRGAQSGQVVLETEELQIIRRFSAAGGGQLIVRDKDGVPVSSPQTKLDKLYSLTTFDPLTFTRQDPKTQAATVRQLAGLDTSKLDAEYQRIFADRTEANRKVREQHARMATIPKSTNVPAEPVKVEDLTEELRQAMEHNSDLERAWESLSARNDELETLDQEIGKIAAEIRRLQERALATTQRRDQLTANRDELKAKLQEKEAIDVSAITERINQAQATNAAIRENERWTEEQKNLIKLEGEADALTERLQAILAEKEQKTAKAKFPIQGLGFNDNGVTFEGIPFEQISSSKKIRVSLAMACALNPDLRVMLIRDGSLLDPDSLKLVREYAEEHEAQVFMECVGDRDDANVIIEDGQVSSTPAQDKKAKAKK